MRFCIYYAVWDGSEYKHWTYSGEGFRDACKAYTDGVQCIIQENPDNTKSAVPGCDIINQSDWYCWREDQGWIGMNSAGYETYMREIGFPKYVIHGYNLRNDGYHEAMRRAWKEGLGA